MQSYKIGCYTLTVNMKKLRVGTVLYLAVGPQINIIEAELKLQVFQMQKSLIYALPPTTACSCHPMSVRGAWREGEFSGALEVHANPEETETSQFWIWRGQVLLWPVPPNPDSVGLPGAWGSLFTKLSRGF